MSNLNKIILIGRLTRDPELRYLPTNGTAVATFNLAVNRRKQGETDFIPIKVWQKQAENCAQYLCKGSLVAVEGRLEVRSFEDKEGARRTATEVVAESVQFLDNKKKTESIDPVTFTQEQMGGKVVGEEDVPF
ncbi:MAG: Single-stranded DNA-binding protein A [Syntrophomonadaceae bacterium]|nr:Single-stranded DNA-binding protein A [Bacillota bacterium]